MNKKIDLLIVHGRDGVGSADHHQIWLAREAERNGLTVKFPIIKGMFSLEADEANVEIKDAILEYQPRLLACHSLGVISLLHVLKDNEDLQCEKVLLAAPARFDPPRDLFPSFYPVPEIDLKQHFASIMLAMAKNDPYRTEAEGAYIENHLGIKATWYDEGAHLNGEEGFGEWKEALDFLTA